MDVKLVSKILGTVMKVAAVLPLLPLPISLLYGELDCIAPLLLTSTLMFVFGITLERIARVERHVRPRHAIVAVPIIWLIIPLFTSLPYRFCEHMSWLDAYFESMSGWTTTGLTVLPDIDHAHRTILFWRSLEQWVGGLGIVVSIISILRFETPSLLYVAEAREERIRPNVVNTAKEMWKIYIMITAVGFLALWAVGMNPFDALNHSMTAVATGGFSTRSESVAAWHSPAVELITVVLMVLGATSFVTHYRVAKTFRTSSIELPARVIKALRQYLQDRQFFTMVGLVIAVTAYASSVSGDRAWDIVRYYGYQAVSAITCCGFSNADVQSFPEYVKLAITVLMIIGGSTASTAGAIKILRFLIMAEAVKAAIARRTQPIRGIVVPRIGSRVLSYDEISDAFAIASAYLFFLLIGTLLLTAYGYPLVDALFEVASAQGGVGLSSGITAPNASSFVKILLIFHMWIGRLEVLPCLAALYWLALIPKRLVVKGKD
ncbi:TrkH family potassium uptake protein [Methanopyrus sp.]